MRDKNDFPRYAIIVLLIIIVLGVIYSIYNTQSQNAPFQEAMKQTEQYNLVAIPTVFAPTKYPPTVTLNWAHAKPDLLRLNLTISGLELVANADDLENFVCNPYINPAEPVSLTLNYREAEIPSQIGEPIVITYEYNMDASQYKTLTFDLDLTIGPCADSLNFQESNITPTLPLPDLIANYHLNFRVPVQ